MTFKGLSLKQIKRNFLGRWEFDFKLSLNGRTIIKHFTCYTYIVRYAFAYDNHNYVRYLTPWLSEILTLETSHLEVYQEFEKGNLSVQLSETNPFGRCEPDRVLERTINKDTKTPGEPTSSSTKTNAVL